MLTVRRAAERGHEDHGWLDSFHTFSFADYYDEAQMGFRALRVINEDRVKGGEGFPTHPHRDMEILSYVLEGGLSHRDSVGSVATLRPGDVQVMSAGTGVRHSEFNASKTEGVHFLQIWLLPEKQGVPPRYQDRHFPLVSRRGQLRLIASPDGAEQSLPIHQDAKVYATVLDAGGAVALPMAKGRHAWVQVARGELEVNGTRLATGDGAALSEEVSLQLKAAGTEVEALVFDLA